MSSGIVFERLVILGVGLIGGSLALAAKQAGAVREVVGWSRRQSTLDSAMELGVIDRFYKELDAALTGADCVVVATPTQLAETVMVDVLEKVDSKVAVTDVASVKGNLQRALQQHFGQVPVNAVLGHPIAGSEKSGVGAAKADLYQNHNVILIDDSHAAGESSSVAFNRVRDLWQATGANVFAMSADDHDRILAHTSHLPHLLAFALVQQLSNAEDTDEILRFAAGGFRDFTRIAGSDPVMWREIFLANQKELLSSITGFEQTLAALRHLLESGEGDKLQAAFSNSKQVRDDFAEQLLARAAGKQPSRQKS